MGGNDLIITGGGIDTVHADQGDDTWLKWFLQFERLLQPLQRISDELEETVEAMR